MTDIPADIREILACPRCHGVLRDEPPAAAQALVCDSCAIVFPIEEGIPVLLEERSTPLHAS